MKTKLFRSTPKPETRNHPVDVGETGRRAICWYCHSGIALGATDANVAGHALSVVLEAFQATGRFALVDRYAQWSKDLLNALPPRPNDAIDMIEHVAGSPEEDRDHFVGYGYCMPGPNGGHECGGALTNYPTQAHMIPVAPHTVYLTDEHRPQ